ncbi:MAG: RimK family protein [Deltaproteobacteria bacterium]|nr:RimK family protein [Deltaproteobacteria bacterium]
MKTVIIVNKKSDIDFDDAQVDILEADEYLVNANHLRHSVRVFNLCRDLSYCKKGYYVSLIAEARGHRPLPNVLTMMDLQLQSVTRFIAENFELQLEKLFSSISSNTFELSIYFGQNLAQKYNQLSRQIFSQFKAPLMRAFFIKKGGFWSIQRVKVLSLKDVPENHKEFLYSAMRNYFAKSNSISKRRKLTRYDLAILLNPEEKHPPSDRGAIKKFISAAQDCRIAAEIITPKDLPLLPQFDALFIRETTSVTDHTFQFARLSEEDGLICIDDTTSILRCCNKIYLNYSLQKRCIPIPATQIIAKGTDLSSLKLPFPIVVKKPDSAFSLGVKKAEDKDELQDICKEYFKHTDLIICQEFMPTTFDWRIGIIDGEPIYACKYYMARDHWQIINQSKTKMDSGDVDVSSIGDAPKEAIKLAIEASRCIGNSLYGIDIKEKNGKFYIIEVNDNPSIEKGYEDKIAQDYLYRRIMETFYKRLEMR